METENLISIAEEQAEFMSSLFVALNHEAEKLGLPMIQRLGAQGVNSLLEAAYRSGKVSEDHFTSANLVVFDALTDASKLIDELWEHLKAATGGYSKEAA